MGPDFFDHRFWNTDGTPHFSNHAGALTSSCVLIQGSIVMFSDSSLASLKRREERKVRHACQLLIWDAWVLRNRASIQHRTLEEGIGVDMEEG